MAVPQRVLGMYHRFKSERKPGLRLDRYRSGSAGKKQSSFTIPLGSGVFGYLNVGADIMARSSDVGREVVDIIQAVMMFFIAAMPC